MNKKIFAIFALLIVAAGITAVSAFDLGDLTGSSEPQNVTIDGIDFSIPAGFVEEDSLAVNGEKDERAGVTYTTWGKTYSKDNEDVISIGVATYDGVEVDNDLASRLGSDSLEVNGVDGYEYNVDNFDGFVYAKDGKLIIISTTDKELLNDIVVK